MSKIVGMMCVRDEEDLLPQVLPHVRSLVDYLYVYEDGSQDNTWDLVKNEHYAIRLQDDKNRLNHYRGNYYHLLEKIRSDFKNEEVWIAITMGDRFFLNKTPRELVEELEGFDAIEGVQLDFLRHRLDPWTEKNDPYPDYSNIRSICRWFKYDERCIILYKLTPYISYRGAKYPWPRGLQKIKYNYRSMQGQIGLEMPYLEHQGRRSPKAAMIRYQNGSRKMSKKYDYDLSNYSSTLETISKFYYSYKLLPWIDNSSLIELIKIRNNKEYKGNKGKPKLRQIFRDLESFYTKNPPPIRKIFS